MLRHPQYVTHGDQTPLDFVKCTYGGEQTDAFTIKFDKNLSVFFSNKLKLIQFGRETKNDTCHDLELTVTKTVKEVLTNSVWQISLWWKFL